MVATPETDRKLIERERQNGWVARQQGKPLSACPWNGGIAELAWKQGWNGNLGSITAQ